MLASVLGSVNWGTPIYLFAIYGIVRYFSKSRQPSSEKMFPVGAFESVGVTLAIYFAAQFMGSLLVYIYPLSQRWSQQHITTWLDSNVLAQFIAVGLIEALTVGLLLYFLKRRKISIRTIGFRRPVWTDLAYVFIGFVIYFALYVVVLNLTKNLVPDLNVNQQQQLGFENAKHFQLVLVFMSLVIFPPIVEETLVRGFLYTGLKSHLPTIYAVLITSMLFAVAHLQADSGASLLWVAALDTFVLSLVLIFLREKTGSLWASIGLHMLKNGIAFFSLFVFHVL